MKLSQLQKKYPKAFNKWIKPELIKADKKYGFGVYELNLNNADVRDAWKEITDFMDRQDIYISCIKTEVKNDYLFDVKAKKDSCISDCYYTTRKETETKAICKAFEILEERETIKQINKSNREYKEWQKEVNYVPFSKVKAYTDRSKL